MSEGVMVARSSTAVRVKSIALPAEHGAWGLLGEAIALGLLVAPSWAGLGVVMAAVGGFLSHQPLKIACEDRLRHRRLPRTFIAERFLALYGATVVVGVAIASRGAEGWWLPLAAAAPLALLQIHSGIVRQGRRLAPELMAAAALAAVAAAVFRAAGLPMLIALGAWALLAAKGLTAVLYVRTRLRLDRGLGARPVVPLLAHLLALMMTFVLVSRGLAPWPAPLAFALLLLRAVHGTTRYRARLRPQAVGFQEVAYGAVSVAIFAAGYWSGSLVDLR
jgi:hypothetical protein